MARLALQIGALAGAAILTAYGQPWAAAAVLAVSTVRDQLFFGPPGSDVTGPRLTDLLIQTSTYGTMKPFAYGHVRMAGDMIWLKGNKLDEEVHHESSGGGKGFGSGGGTATFYTYSATCAFAFCEGPVQRVNKLWGDGKLFYDAGGAPAGYVIYATDLTANSFIILEISDEVIAQFGPGTVVTVSGSIDNLNDGTYTVVSAAIGSTAGLEALEIVVTETIPSPVNLGLIVPPGATSGHEKYPDVVQIYLGTEDQLPDPAIEADKGVGQVPGYRGTCYIVFNALPLADFANHIPNITAEIWAGDSPVLVSAIVSDLCLRAGLTAEDINTTALTQTILGYTVSRRTSARASLQALADILQFDGVESDDVIRWAPRSDVPLLTIPATALAAHASTEPVPSLLEITDTQEVELPERVELTYVDVDRDYQEAMQYGGRVQAPIPTQFSRRRTAIQAPMVLTADMAKQQARRLLYEAWATRFPVAFQTSRRYARLDPSDTVLVEDTAIAYTVRLGQSDYGASGLIQWKSVSVDATYAITGTGASVELPPSIINDPGITVLHVVDTSLLRQEDDDAGFYVAVVGINPSWHGAVVNRSLDDSTYAPIAALTVPAKAGQAFTVMQSRVDASTWDTVATVDVRMTTGAPESFTKDAVLRGLGQSGLLGDEIIQWTGVTQLDPVTYRLGGATQPLLRGRRGTEWAMSTHVLGEPFLILEAGTLRRYSAPVSDLGVERFYKAVSVGKELVDATTEHVMARGLGLKPFAPEHIRGTRTGVSEASGGTSSLPEYWAMRDSAGVSWYFWFDSLGNLHSDPSTPGVGFLPLTTGTPPNWHQVTDETGAIWWLVVDTLGQLQGTSTLPSGTGIVFGPEASAGITAMGQDGATLYRMTIDSLGQGTVLSDVTPPPPPSSGTDIVITWRSRTRYPWESLDGVSAPRSDDESYQLVVYNAGIGVRIITDLTSATWTYLAAWQSEDFGGSIPAQITVGVWQNNAIVGPGHEGVELYREKS